MQEQPTIIDLAGLPEVFVDTTYRSLGHLLGEWPETFDELVAAARDDDYAMSVEAARMLDRFGLLDQAGKVRPTVVPVVSSAANGDGPALISYAGIAEYRTWTRPGPAPVPMTKLLGASLGLQSGVSPSCLSAGVARAFRVVGFVGRCIA